MTAVERIALLRAQEQIDQGQWRLETAPKPVLPVHTYVGLCGMCGTNQITERNKSGACRDCWHRLSPARRREWTQARKEREAA